MQNIIFVIGQCIFLPSYLYTTRKLLRKPFNAKTLLGYIFLSPLMAYIYAVFATIALAVILPQQYRTTLTMSTDFIVLAISVILMVIYGRRLKRQAEASFLYGCLYLISMPFTATYPTIPQALLYNVLSPIIVNAAYIFLIFNPFRRYMDKCDIASNRLFVMLPIVAELMFVLRLMSFLYVFQHEDLHPYDGVLTVYNWFLALLVLIFVFLAVRLIIYCMDESSKYKQASERIQVMSVNTATSLVRAIEARDPYTVGHSERVAKYSQMIAERMGKTQEYIEKIYYRAILHDVGKIGIADSILQKPGPLEKEEFEEVKSHTIKGYHILENVGIEEDLTDGALYHHERWDGTGYPKGLAGDAIPEIARIIAVADAYDAMTSNRPYRPLLTQQAVYEQIKDGIGTQFWADAAEIMLQIMQEDAEYMLHQ